MKTYKITMSEKELNLLKKVVDFGNNVLDYNSNKLSSFFKDREKAYDLLEDIKFNVFNTHTVDTFSKFNKKTKLRKYALMSIDKKLKN